MHVLTTGTRYCYGLTDINAPCGSLLVCRLRSTCPERRDTVSGLLLLEATN